MLYNFSTLCCVQPAAQSFPIIRSNWQLVRQAKPTRSLPTKEKFTHPDEQSFRIANDLGVCVRMMATDVS